MIRNSFLKSRPNSSLRRKIIFAPPPPPPPLPLSLYVPRYNVTIFHRVDPSPYDRDDILHRGTTGSYTTISVTYDQSVVLSFVMNEIDLVEKSKMGEKDLIDKTWEMRPYIKDMIFLHWAWMKAQEEEEREDLPGWLLPGKVKEVRRRNHLRHIDSRNIIGDPCQRVLRPRKV